MKNANAVQVDQSRLAETRRASTEIQISGEKFTPGDFFREAGAIIAVCLGLGVLMQLLLP